MLFNNLTCVRFTLNKFWLKGKKKTSFVKCLKLHKNKQNNSFHLPFILRICNLAKFL